MMNKALSWTLRGADDETRQTLRRQAPSLSERLLGVRGRDVAEPSESEEPSREASSVGTAALLERAIGVMERSAQHTERCAEDTLSSLTKLLETSERRRESERAGVAALAVKLAEIDSRLSDQDRNPVLGALARLEARIERMSPRDGGAGAASLDVTTAAAGREAAEPIRRLEAKLTTVLEAIAAGSTLPSSEASPIALAAARGPIDAGYAELPLPRRRLRDAIADIAERQRLLDAKKATTPKAIPSGVGTIANAPTKDRCDVGALRKDVASMGERLRELAPRCALTAIEGRLSRLETRLDSTPRGDIGAAIDGLRADVGAIDGRIGALERSAAPIDTIARLQGRIDEMRDLVDDRLAPTPGFDRGALESLVEELGRKIDAARSPDAGAAAVDALQRDIAAVAARLQSTETGLASLAATERSIQDLFAHLEETRSLVQTSAAEAVRAAVAEHGLDRLAPLGDLAGLKSLQENADRHTRATLDAVHATLRTVVDRLAVVERDLAETRRSGASQDVLPATERDPSRHAAHSVADDRHLATVELSVGSAGPSVRPAEGLRAGKADFIAAARRAAHAAQTDPSVAAIRDREPDGRSAIRADLLAKSRDYVASHKRPVLLALAAVLMVAATTALVRRTSLEVAWPGVVARELPAKVAALRVALPRRVSMPAAAAKAAHPLPAAIAQIPGSDPIVTGSIQSLPALTHIASAAVAPPPPVSLPSGLVRMAEAGDGAAEYVLAGAYAEGRGVPQDLQSAAKLFAKAADKGIVAAQYRLGAMYEKGLGVAQDRMRAMSLYRHAAEAGNPRAMHNLAVLLADGDGDGRPDYVGAARWFRQAAQYGVRDSAYNYAILLARGLGVDQSLVQAHQWFAIAASEGDADAAHRRDEVASRLDANELAVAKALAAGFHARSPDPAAVEVASPATGWDGASSPLHINSAITKIS